MRLLVLFAMPVLLQGAVSRIYVVERTDVLDGRPLGAAGAYERVIAKVHFTLDPKLAANQMIRDLDLAPRNTKGFVEFSADLYVLKPRDPAQGNRVLLFEVSNRGGKGMLARFNGARSSMDPRAAEEFGDLWLMKQGYTLAWLGWQWDLPEGANLLRMDAPVAAGLKGPVRAEFIPDSATRVMPLGDRNHVPYAPIAPESASLTVRPRPEAPRQAIAKGEWKFTADGRSIEMTAGFRPGMIYEAVYTAENPRVQGVGMAGIRDLISFLRHQSDGLSALGDQPQFLRQAIAFGISQSGRFLRTFLYYGMNSDERGRKVFDGVWADVAGAGRGSFNHRFAQASRDGHAFLNLLFPTDLYPFTDLPYEDPAGGRKEGLLDRVPAAAMPKIFYTNGSYEYWGRAAALIHSMPDGKLDADLPANTRVYFLAGVQHGPGRVPPQRARTRNLANPVDFRPFQRATLENMRAWVQSGKEPPASRHPRLDRGELVTAAEYRNPAGPHPKRAQLAWHAHYGPEFESKGIVSIEPPKLGAAFPALVPKADADGIDMGGVRMPEVSTPVGTLAGWNFRSEQTGAAEEPAAMVGSFLPWDAKRIEARYGNREQYRTKLAEAADQLVRDRFVLPEDREKVIERALALWDFVVQKPR